VRILYLITRSEPGGAQSHLNTLIEHFGSEVVGVAAGLDEDNSLVGMTQKVGVEFIPIQHMMQPLHMVNDVRATFEIAEVLRRVKPDLVHIHSSKAGIVGRISARMIGIPSVFTAHGWAFADGVSWKRKMLAVPSEFAFGRLTDRIITVSQTDYDLAIRHNVASAKRMTVVWNGIEDTVFRAQPGVDDEVRIVMVARFAPQKDHDTLIRALKGLEGRWRVLLIGDGALRGEHERLARDLGIADRVEFLGSRRDVPEILSKAHVFVLTTNWEGLPISILEGMRAGLPVVASNVGGIAELVQDGQNGFLVPRFDAQSVRMALQRLVSDRALRERFGRASRTRYEADFTAQRMFDQMRSVYASVLRSGSSSGGAR
jgi:glycosyltransferase involved in cell wall biosynthesis